MNWVSGFWTWTPALIPFRPGSQVALRVLTVSVGFGAEAWFTSPFSRLLATPAVAALSAVAADGTFPSLDSLISSPVSELLLTFAPVTAFFLILADVTAFFLSCAGPTLFLGSAAAYAVPLSAIKSASTPTWC
jgi:hypothetical protein